MPEITKCRDFVLKITDNSATVRNIINKYDMFLEALCKDEYSFQREAVKKAISFYISEEYRDISDLARINYNANEKLQNIYADENSYINSIPLNNKKICSIDLATGTGKSYVMYGIAIIMLAEKLVNKVLVLCPSLTIEEGLKKKFDDLNSNEEIQLVIKEVIPSYEIPEIVTASVTVLENQICIENIHATYLRTGSSISDSFSNQKEDILVINDEAHHVFSGEADSGNKKWKTFLEDSNYNFRYITNLTGTPYYMGRDQYFLDVIYSFPIKDAVENNIIKKIDYKIDEEFEADKNYQDTFAFHKSNIDKYGKYLKPLTIIVTDKIFTAIRVWDELIKFIIEQEECTEEEVVKKVIWVTSGLPSNKREEAEVFKILSRFEDTPETIRKKNIELLKTVDDKDNPVEWIISVAMLTEGWDVKNVFQIVPHEQKAFNSRLLISQVLGRGLRIPQVLKDKNIPALVKINNHEKWTERIKNLYEEVIGIEDYLSWGYDKNRKKYLFPLYNFDYEAVETTTEVKGKLSKSPEKFGFSPQNRKVETTDKFALGDSIKYHFEITDIYELDEAVNYLFVYLKQKDKNLVKKWNKIKIKEEIVKELKKKGYPRDFLSKDNFIKAQQAFGPLFRELGKEFPRLSQKPNNLIERNIEQIKNQNFSEYSFRQKGAIFYDKDSCKWFKGDEYILFNSLINIGEKIDQTILAITEKNQNREDIKEESDKLNYLNSTRTEIEDKLFSNAINNFKTPLNLIYVDSTPEITFMKTLFNNIDLLDSFIKSNNKGFYYFPYSYKPETDAKTHVKQDNFNPDFFLKLKNKNEIMVVEIKNDGDDSNRNKAKYRDGNNHFEELNERLKKEKIDYKYIFKFLSPENNDIVQFFEAIRNGNYTVWKSSLMNELLK